MASIKFYGWNYLVNVHRISLFQLHRPEQFARLICLPQVPPPRPLHSLHLWGHRRLLWCRRLLWRRVRRSSLITSVIWDGTGRGGEGKEWRSPETTTEEFRDTPETIKLILFALNVLPQIANNSCGYVQVWRWENVIVKFITFHNNLPFHIFTSRYILLLNTVKI